MFTGIITAKGKLKEIKKAGKIYQLGIIGEGKISGLKKGDSIAVDGVCLTLKENKNGILYFDVIPTTFNNTRFKYIRTGCILNLELPVKIDSFISGHLVTGHVDCVGQIKNIKKAKDGYSMDIKFPNEYKIYVVEKGSIAVNGVSLTIQKIKGNYFSVDLIPITLNHTNLGVTKIGDKVNLEFDYIGKYILNYLKNLKFERN
jgi:riboflavin synthase